MSLSTPACGTATVPDFSEIDQTFAAGGSIAAKVKIRKPRARPADGAQLRLFPFARSDCSAAEVSKLTQTKQFILVAVNGVRVGCAERFKEATAIEPPKYQALPLEGRAENVVAVLPSTKARLMRRSFCDMVRRDPHCLRLAYKLRAAGYVRVGDVAQMAKSDFAQAGLTPQHAEIIRRLLETWHLRAAARAFGLERLSSVEIKSFVFAGAAPPLVSAGFGPDGADAV